MLGPDGWCPPMTFGGTDATLEEVSLAAGPTGALLATQADGRLSRALHWSEGFGGRECPYLADHHGAVIWHGVHGAGQVVLTTVASAGPAAIDGRRSASIVSARAAARPAGGRAADDPTFRWTGWTYRPVLGRPAPPLARQPLHLGRRTLAGGLLPLRLGRQRVRLLGGDRPRRELHRLPVVEHPEDRRPAARARPLRAALRVRVDVGRTRPPERHLRRRRPRSPDLLRLRRGQHHPGRALAGAGRPPAVPGRSPSRTTPARRWCTTTGTTTIPASAGSSRSSRRAGATTSRRVCFRQYSDGTATGTFMLDGLLRGHRFGLIASSDHGHGASYVAVLARSLSPG